MKAEWKIKKLGEIAAVGAGNSAPQDEELFKDGTIPFFRTADAGRVRFGEIREAEDYLNDNGAKRLRRFNPGTILFPKSGASTFLNYRVMLGVEGCVSSHLATIVVDENIVCSRFLLYFLSTIVAQDLVQDHAYPSLNLPVIEDIEVPLPPLSEQKRVVVLLDEVFQSLAIVVANAKSNLDNARSLFKSHLESIFNERGPGWLDTSFEDCIEGVKYTRKIQRKEFLKEGRFPVVSQEAGLINGYWNNAADVFSVTRPIVIFGDHTQVLKYVDFDFVLGADGVKLLWPKPFLDPKFFFYALRGVQLKSLGYARHYRLLKELQIGYPDMSAQAAIIKRLDGLENEIQRLSIVYKRKLATLEELKKSLLHAAFAGEL